MNRIVSITLLLLTLTAAPLLAQWTKSLAVNTAYDNNAFRNYEGISDYVTRISASIARDTRGENWQSRMFYRGGYNFFASSTDRSFHHHQLGATLAYSFNQGNDLLNLGANGGLRSNRELYSYYNFTTASAFANI